ncbi:MAG: bifunctional methylenetetrahydrofolate dehydrogenase/methenyltetrahydrofolate cyclohydrolase FolD [Oligoflexia bacterium]|nr:bifunctional methylenetetrahydrofolate dehydrogenase/methenyltetrahydrofolate cyclohydrolase FolD [Oligoflexia bacterium]
MASVPKILDGKWLAEQVLSAVQREVAALVDKRQRVPGLGVLLVGDNAASKAYVANKEKSAAKCGFQAFDVRLPADATYEQVRDAVLSFNSDERVDGILMQLPLPGHLDSSKLLDLIDPNKDADGLHPLNQGLLMKGAGMLRPCTPLGVMKHIDLAFSNIDPQKGQHAAQDIATARLDGKHVVVIGRSVLVGKPVGFLCLERNATVTFAHSKTKDLPAVCRTADIVIAAVGVPHLVKADWVKEGAVVIDVGINRLPNGKLTGDVDFDSVAPKSSAITPVPGGVGPMTVAMLIQNTLHACKSRQSQATK